MGYSRRSAALELLGSLSTLEITLNSTVKAALDNGFDFYFASATCGNDELAGSVPGVPEPGT